MAKRTPRPKVPAAMLDRLRAPMAAPSNAIVDKWLDGNKEARDLIETWMDMRTAGETVRSFRWLFLVMIDEYALKLSRRSENSFCSALDRRYGQRFSLAYSVGAKGGSRV